MKFLERVKVIEFSHMVMGPSTGMMLGDLGARVIKIEPIGGDKTRRLHGSGAGYFAMFNRNKQSMCLDVSSSEGKEIIRRLLKDADVVIENFRPGALAKRGLGYKQIKDINPRIIYQSSKGFLSGPYEQRTALDEVAQMMGGLAYMTGPKGRPLRAGSSVIDITGGMFGVIGILAALFQREQTGEGGVHMVSSLFESAVFLVGQHMAQHAVTGAPPDPMPSRVSAWAIYDVFETMDGQIFVGVVSDRQWAKFCDIFGFNDWKADPNLADNNERVKSRPALIPVLQARFRKMKNDQLMVKLAEAELPFAPINRPQDLPNDPHVKAGGLHELFLADQNCTVSLPKLPIEVNGTRPDKAIDPPVAGENTNTILAQLGYDAEQIEAWRKQGVVE